MPQRIYVDIASHKYEMHVDSPEQEHNLRVAAERLNQVLKRYQEKFVNVSEVDVLSFAALNESMAALGAIQEVERLRKQIKNLESDFSTYLESQK